MKKSIAMVAASAVLAASASLCSTAAFGQAVKTGGVLHAVIQPEPVSLNMAVSQAGVNQIVASNIYESLLRFDAQLKPMPSLAERWTITEQGKVYTFYLKKNVKWHDGKLFTAEDVEFTVDKVLRKHHARLNAQLGYLQKIEVVDPQTIRFVLSQAYGPFIMMFETGTMPILPKHIYQGVADYANAKENQTPIGTGPFKFDKWEKGSYIHLVKNPAYHVAGQPVLDEIYWHVIPDAAARALAYETGKVDVLPGGSVENFDIKRLSALQNSCVTTKGWELFSPQSILWLNNRNRFLSDKRFRQAVAYALDMEFAKDVVWSGYGKVAISPLNSSARFSTDKIKKYPRDLAKAKELLKAVGYDGTPIRMMPLPFGEVWQRWGESIKQNLEEAGIKVTMVGTDAAGFNKKMGDWDYDLANTFFYTYGDPALGVTRFFRSDNIAKGSPWNNVVGYQNPELDKVMAAAAVAYPDSEREKLYAQMQSVLAEDVPAIGLTEMAFPMVYRCNVKNLVVTGTGISDGLNTTWVDRK